MFKTHRVTLDNGLQVVGIQRPHSTLGAVAVDVRVGGRYESKKEGGLSHFLEHMVFKGCAGFADTAAVNRAAERMGGAVDAFTSRDRTHYSHLVTADALDRSADLLARLLRAPAFASIESERGIILEELRDEYDEDGDLVDAEAISRMALWPDSPLGRSVAGTEQTVRSFTREDLERHHQRHYGAANMVLTLVGPGEPEALVAVGARPFAHLPRGETVAPPAAPPTNKQPQVSLVPDARSQVECRLAFPTPGRRHPDAAAIALLRLCLDDGLASRLHRRLGDELGLAYEQWAEWERYVDAGAFELGAVLTEAKAQIFVREAFALLRGLRDAPPTGDELAHIRFRARWALQTLTESPEGLVSLYGTPALFGDPTPSMEERLERIGDVGTETLSRVAGEIFVPDGSVGCFVGPMKKPTRRALRATFLRFDPAG